MFKNIAKVIITSQDTISFYVPVKINAIHFILLTIISRMCYKYKRNLWYCSHFLGKVSLSRFGLIFTYKSLKLNGRERKKRRLSINNNSFVQVLAANEILARNFRLHNCLSKRWLLLLTQVGKDGVYFNFNECVSFCSILAPKPMNRF